MILFYYFLVATFTFAAVIIVGLFVAFQLFPMSKPGKTFFRIFVDGDYDGQ